MINDVDILYIYDDVADDGRMPLLSRSTYDDIVRLNDTLSAEVSNGAVIVPSYNCGPFKPAPRDRTVIETHNLIYTVNRWRLEDKTFLFDRARRYTLLWGEPPGNIHNTNHIETSDVLKDVFGIEDCLRMIGTRTVRYFVWETSPEQSNAMKVTSHLRRIAGTTEDDKCLLVELLFYSAIRSSVNSVRTVTSEANDVPTDCALFVERFRNFEQRGFLAEVVELKRKYRRGEIRPDSSLVDSLSNKTIAYLMALRDFLCTV